MSIVSEIHAEITAKKIEKIILKALNAYRYKDIRSAVKGFINEELIEWYYNECGETWGSYEAHPDILKAFPPKKE